jgi:hypothetical protein
MIKPEDVELLKLIDARGPVKYEIAKHALGEDYRNTVTRCKGRGLIMAITENHKSYRYELSPLGQDVLDAVLSSPEAV